MLQVDSILHQSFYRLLISPRIYQNVTLARGIVFVRL